MNKMDNTGFGSKPFLGSEKYLILCGAKFSLENKDVRKVLRFLDLVMDLKKIRFEIVEGVQNDDMQVFLLNKLSYSVKKDGATSEAFNSFIKELKARISQESSAEKGRRQASRSPTPKIIPARSSQSPIKIIEYAEPPTVTKDKQTLSSNSQIENSAKEEPNLVAVKVNSKDKKDQTTRPGVSSQSQSSTIHDAVSSELSLRPSVEGSKAPLSDSKDLAEAEYAAAGKEVWRKKKPTTLES